MAVRIDIRYEGDLHCSAVHGPSGEKLLTDAPVDNRGKGEHFSPTDLVAASLGACILTTMEIAAQKREWSLPEIRASVDKEMSSVPRRHISRLAVELTMPASLEARQRAVLEAAAHTCPVAASLGPDTEVDLKFDYV